MTIDQDLPVLSDENKKYALMGLARCGLTFADCAHFFAMEQSKEELAIADKAKELEEEGELEFDDTPIVSKADTEEGAYVMAWVWVDGN